MPRKPTYEELEQRINELEREVAIHEHAELKLKESEEKYRMVIDNCSEAIFVVQDGMLKFMNAVAVEFAGVSAENSNASRLDRPYTKWLHPDDQEKVAENYLKRIRAEEVPSEYDIRVIDKDQHLRWMSLRPTKIMWEDRAATLNFMSDVSRRRQVEEALRESEKRYALAVKGGNVGVWDWNLKTNEIFVAPNLKAMLGYKEHEITDRIEDWASHVHPADESKVMAEAQANIDGTSQVYQVEHRMLHKDGGVRWFLASGKVERNPDGIPVRFIGTDTDITERKRAEEAIQDANEELERRVEERTRRLVEANRQLKQEIEERKRAEDASRESERRYRLLAENVDDSIWTTDMDMNLTYVSPSIERMRGYTVDEVLVQTLEEIFTAESRKLVTDIFLEERALEQSEKRSDIPRSRTFEAEHICKDGSTLWTETKASFLRDRDGRPAGILGVTRDISERRHAEEEKRKLEAQLQKAMKMQAIGTLAGGIAHEFNNILWMIIGNTELALSDIPEGNPARYSLGLVEKACQRGKGLVSQILSFSRQIKQENIPVKIGPIVREALKLLRASIPTTIEIRKSISARADTVLADPTKIHQVFMNLFANAAHAMREKGGLLEVCVKDIRLDENGAALHQDLVPGRYVRITVRDTGQGMHPDVMECIFDPFFTTKVVGEGTGMGLSVVHGIVKDHGGAITVQSEPGKGAIFDVFFPCIEGEVKHVSESVEAMPTGNERILFVEDEEDAVGMAKKLLERLGYQVESSINPVEALEAFRNQPNKYDLVITDMSMPHMTGAMLAKEMLAIRPDIPIILCTGFSEMISEDSAKAIGIREFAMKPLRIRDLARIIRKVLYDK